ncbi:hydroxymethylbilane synthase [Vagococcus fessus]|uniref:Porphobilinogen deaminase n=1 Tax=Vagococcus fessus TaxID=120370 RepID=A0A430AD02_9ENTE|nr:hydroxymethylbilane synthase [Vagococcus fessus]RSU05089.1 hydroxymethylbilane synthase [Vagococcus fessus]
MKKTYVVGTRKSQLAMTQTKQTVTLLEEKFPDITFEIKGIVTKGDRLATVHLSKIGGKGVFMKQIEAAIVSGEIDFAVHSMKDVPSVLPEEVTIAAIPPRNSPWDVLVSKNGLENIEDLPKNSIIGTSSVRRGSQLLAWRPDLQLKNIRGNIDTRLKKLAEEDYDAIILAEAGLNRLGWNEKITGIRLSKELCIPAVGQGALGVECLKDRPDVLELLQAIDCPITRRCVEAERTFLSQMDGSCTFPIGGYSEILENKLTLTGFLSNADGSIILKEVLQDENAEQLGTRTAALFNEKGAKSLIKKYRDENA